MARPDTEITVGINPEEALKGLSVIRDAMKAQADSYRSMYESAQESVDRLNDAMDSILSLWKDRKYVVDENGNVTDA